MLSKEGVIQKDPVAMMLYALALLPLGESLQEDIPESVQSFYTDNLVLVGAAAKVADAFNLLMKCGLSVSCFPETEKSARP